MDAKLLSKLIANGENKEVDFKKEIYDIGKNNLESQASFVKDLISLANTRRNSSAYIIIGIEDKSREIVGLDKGYDDNPFQTFVKNRLIPKLDFIYYNFRYKEKILGIFEIPIQSLSEPVVYDDPNHKDELEKTGKIKARKVYHRQGSTNEEATEIERGRIRQWLDSLPLSTKVVPNLPKISVNSSEKPIFKIGKKLLLTLEEAIILQKKGQFPSFVFEDKEYQAILGKIEKIESKSAKNTKDREKLISLNEKLEEKRVAHDTLHYCLEILIDFNANNSIYRCNIKKQFEGLLNVLNKSYWDDDNIKYDAWREDFTFSIYLTRDNLEKLRKKMKIKFNTLDEFIENSTKVLGLQVSDLEYEVLVSNVIPKFIYQLSLDRGKKSIENIRYLYAISDYFLASG